LSLAVTETDVPELMLTVSLAPLTVSVAGMASPEAGTPARDEAPEIPCSSREARNAAEDIVSPIMALALRIRILEYAF
jgi:hypothetical protein